MAATGVPRIREHSERPWREASSAAGHAIELATMSGQERAENNRPIDTLSQIAENPERAVHRYLAASALRRTSEQADAGGHPKLERENSRCDQDLAGSCCRY